MAEAALKDSKLKAEKLLASAGRSLGDILSISVGYSRLLLDDDPNRSATFDFKGKQIQSKDVNVTYEIK
jgi:hypothetical protein